MVVLVCFFSLYFFFLICIVLGKDGRNYVFRKGRAMFRVDCYDCDDGNDTDNDEME